MEPKAKSNANSNVRRIPRPLVPIVDELIALNDVEAAAKQLEEAWAKVESIRTAKAK